MAYTTIRIEGNILAPDVLKRMQAGDIHGQQPADFGLKNPLREEIQFQYGQARRQWETFQSFLNHREVSETGTSETRRLWILPLLQFLGYEVERGASEEMHGKTYAISHRGLNCGRLPIHIVGVRDELDRKREQGGTRLSPHALVQEYLNLNDHLYGLLTNGKKLRLLRDSGQLVRLTYLEFDLEALMTGDHLAEFGLLYRILHPTRMPREVALGPECLLEAYHQESLSSGARIREGLSRSVRNSIEALGLGYVQHPANEALRQAIAAGDLSAQAYYQQLLRLIYRLLFLFVIEERDLVFGQESEARLRGHYYDYYSLSRLRRLSEKRYLADPHHSDLWIALRQTFRLFRAEKYGKALGIKALSGDLFGENSLPDLERAQLSNEVLLGCIRDLSRFYHAETQQYVVVNYAMLNVEEFGSVYENLLELEPQLSADEGEFRAAVFSFVKGTDRSTSGSHYIPDELVKPLIAHSLDHLIEEKLKLAATPADRKVPLSSLPSTRSGGVEGSSRGDVPSRQEAALLSLRVCDVACGSGHILLAAARRIGMALARVRSGEDQPGPAYLRLAVRDAIRHCIYGVDKNPLAVELCKVALWLEAHVPGEPLSFLDHRIRCGDAIVGLARYEELGRGIVGEAFKTLPGDDKEVAAELRKRNKAEGRKDTAQTQLDFGATARESLGNLSRRFAEIDDMPERTPEEVEARRNAYERLLSGESYWRLKTLADLQVAQFFLPKTPEYKPQLMTTGEYRALLAGRKALQGNVRAAKATAVAGEKRFFHWFLEFPEVFAPQRGGARLAGFDCILGNPPFLGGMKLSTAYGADYLNFLHSQYEGAKGTADFVAYFFRRINDVLRPEGFQSLISTNTIAQGDTRLAGLAYLVEKGNTINHAVRSMRWPGLAAVEVALVTINKGQWKGNFVLDQYVTSRITSYLDDAENLGDPVQLVANENQSFIGSYVLGKGFILEPEQAAALIDRNPDNEDVIRPYLNGEDLNSRPDQSPSRYVINFQDWPLRRYTEAEWGALTEKERETIRERIRDERSVALAPPDYTYEVAADYPDCLEIVEREVRPERQRWKTDSRGKEIVGTYALRKPLPELWWIYGEKRPALYRTIEWMKRVLAAPRVTKTHAFSFVPVYFVFSDATTVLAFSSFLHYLILQSSHHEHWAWQYSSTMKGDRRYSPSTCFETFPFPRLIPKQESQIEAIGARYHAHRQRLMAALQMGLTKIYNQFHNEGLKGSGNREQGTGSREPGAAWGDEAAAARLAAEIEACPAGEVAARYGRETASLLRQIAQIAGTSYALEALREPVSVPAATLAEAIYGIWELRRLHVEMDAAVLAAYGWDRAASGASTLPSLPEGAQGKSDPAYAKPIVLDHGFHEVDYLPENDRVRFTVSPAARREILRRLLLLNHARFEAEAREGLPAFAAVQAYFAQKGAAVPEDIRRSYQQVRARGKGKTQAAKPGAPPQAGAQGALF